MRVIACGGTMSVWRESGDTMLRGDVEHASLKPRHAEKTRTRLCESEAGVKVYVPGVRGGIGCFWDIPVSWRQATRGKAKEFDS